MPSSAWKTRMVLLLGYGTPTSSVYGKLHRFCPLLILVEGAVRDVDRQLLTVALSFCFFFNDPAATEIYTLSLHDALPISHRLEPTGPRRAHPPRRRARRPSRR